MIQEVANAAEALVHMGPIVYSWTYFAHVMTRLQHNDMDTYLWFRGEVTAIMTIYLMDKLASHKNSPSARPNLLEFLMLSRHSKSTIASDKIYSLLGLVSEADKDDVTINYSLSDSEVYKRYATSYLTRRNNLSILYACTKSGRSSTLSLPSWIPDWTQPCYHDPLLFQKYDARAAGASTPKLRLLNEGDTNLFVRGKLVDIVSEVESLRPIPFHSETVVNDIASIDHSSHKKWTDDFMQVSRTWAANAMRIAFPDNTCTARSYEALWRTIICNRTHEGKVPPAEGESRFSDFIVGVTAHDYQSLRQKWMQEARGPWDLGKRYGKEDPWKKRMFEILRFIDASGIWCHSRRFFRTRDGRFGWGPNAIEAGDQSCILYGGDIPFVFRPTGTGRHEIVGDCYVHGFMDGEAMSDAIEDCEFCLV